MRVTGFAVAPGAETAWHRHGNGDAIPAGTKCEMELVEPGEGRRRVTVPAGTAKHRVAGVEPEVINAAAAETRFVEVDLLGQARQGLPLPHRAPSFDGEDHQIRHGHQHAQHDRERAGQSLEVHLFPHLLVFHLP